MLAEIFRAKTTAIILTSLAVLSAHSALHGADPAPTNKAEEASAIRRIFDFDLTQIIRPESLRITISPSWRDFISRDAVRIRTRVRYAFNEHLEGTIELVPYFDNFGSGDTPTGLRIAEYKIGAKYAWPVTDGRDFSAAVGFSITHPAPNTPDSLATNSARFSPYVVFSRVSKNDPRLSSYVNVGFEFFDSDPTNIAPYRPSRDNLVIAPGIAFNRAPWNYSFSTPVRTTLISGDDRYYLSLIPAVTYTIPQKYTRFFKGQWTAGLAYEGVLYDEGMEHRFTGRLSWDIDWFKTVKEHIPWGKK